MFSFFRKKPDAFQQRRKQQEVWKSVRRLVDASAPNLLHAAEQARSDNRQNRCLPALLVPVVDEQPQLDEHAFAVTRDFSDEGVSLFCVHEVTASQVICAFWDDGPIFMLGDVRQVRPFGAGFWSIGIHLDEVLPNGQLQMLNSLASQLAPEVAELAAAN